MKTNARAYWVARPDHGEIREIEIRPCPADHSRLATVFTGVSVGTERLVGRGEVPADCTAPMACRYMDGDLRLPVKYGYSLVGQAIEGKLAGKHVFVMHPHQDRVVVADEDATVLPASVPPRRGVLIPNLETALNAVWDAAPLGRAGWTPGAPSLVVGGGAVGLLVAYVLARRGGSPVPLVEVDEDRARLAEELPWVASVVEPGDVARRVPEERQVAFHASGSGRGLQCALDAVGFEGRVIELSWYGTRPVQLDLGADFHYRRKTIEASQVSSIAPSHRDTHDHRSRLDEVVRLLDDPALDLLLGDPVPFADMPAWMDALYRGAQVAPLPLIDYSQT